MFVRNSRFAALAFVTVLALPTFAQSDSKASKPKPPSQAQLARKGSFAVVAAGDGSVKGALSATDLKKAKTKVNQTATFSGKVTDIFAPKNAKRVLLDFAKNYKTAVIGLVDAKSFKTFPDLKQLKGKKVVISGKVILYKEQLQVELTSPGAIKIVK